MPILFVHGVNTRDSDEDYYRSVGARKKMFEQFVVPEVTPGFAVADDVYWGDLGVRFGWGLASVPSSDLQSLGAGAGQDNPELLALLATAPETAAGDVQSLGSADPPAMLTVAAERPGDLVRAMWSARMLSYDPTRPNADPSLAPTTRATLEDEGQGIALLMIAGERVARRVDQDPSLLSPEPGTSTLDWIAKATAAELASLSPATAASSDVQGLGTGLGGLVSKPFKWAGDKIADLTSTAKATAQKVKDTTARGASLLVLQAARDDLSRKGVRFIGDVFEYLHRGRGVPPSIASRVTDAVKAAAATAAARSEPFVLVTHSFGAMIVYDALTAGQLNGVTIDLWVTVGAQTSLFAEMALFQGSAPIVSGAAPAPIGKPANVGRWLNFYDAADVLSYLHEPVFGKDAVTDVSVRGGGNLANAHGHYFLTVSFYERIAEEVRALTAAP